jgi:hypothetical protein
MLAIAIPGERDAGLSDGKRASSQQIVAGQWPGQLIN